MKRTGADRENLPDCCVWMKTAVALIDPPAVHKIIAQQTAGNRHEKSAQTGRPEATQIRTLFGNFGLIGIGKHTDCTAKKDPRTARQ